MMPLYRLTLSRSTTLTCAGVRAAATRCHSSNQWIALRGRKKPCHL